MDRIYASGASATPPSVPSSPSSGYPTGGNPGLGTPASKPGPYWYYMMTEELRAVISAAGLTPDHANLSQLLSAIQKLISAGGVKIPARLATTANISALSGGAPSTVDGLSVAAGDRVLVKDQTTASQNGIYVVSVVGSGANGTWVRASDADESGDLYAGALVVVAEGSASADTLWEITTDGAITVGTTAIAFVRKDSASFASTAEAQAFALSNKAISPATLSAALQGSNQSLAATGYQKLPGGLILQWGVVSALSAGASAAVTFPVAFPTAVYSITTGYGLSASNSGGNRYSPHVISPTTTGFTAENSDTSVLTSFYWFALGK